MGNEIHLPAAGQSGEQMTVRSVRLWIKSFIPEDIDGAERVADGPHAGKTMFRSPGPIDVWYLTDQRGFSNDIQAFSRMHSEIELDFVDFTIKREHHQCDPTIQITHDTGAEECHETAGTEYMTFSEFTISPDAKRMTLHLHGSSKNACLKLGPVKVAPSLDYSADIVVWLGKAGQEVTIEVDSWIETYPAFEMYVSVNNKPPDTIFQAAIEPDATPLSLIGPATRHIEKSLTLSL